jgi:histidinol-phosphate aminotransferase
MSIFKSHIDAMSHYKPPLEGRDPERFDLLDFNERTMPIADTIAREISDWVMSGRLQVYPSYGNITEKIAEYAAVAPEQIMITNGSDQGIDLIIRSMCRAGDEIIIPEPSFAMYRQCAQIENLDIVSPWYSKQTGYPVDEVLAAITDKTRVIIVSNPNNPSATILDRENILRLAKAAPDAAILVDECYFEYSKVTVADFLDVCPNIVITRTFSKTWGLPSLRIGYVIASSENIDALLKVRGPYDINQLAVVAVNAALKHHGDIQSYIEEVMEKSKPLLESFLKDQAIAFWPSSANFIWAFFDDAESLEYALRESGILVRPKANQEGVVGLRITIGTLEQTKKLISVIENNI